MFWQTSSDGGCVWKWPTITQIFGLMFVSADLSAVMLIVLQTETSLKIASRAPKSVFITTESMLLHLEQKINGHILDPTDFTAENVIDYRYDG